MHTTLGMESFGKLFLTNLLVYDGARAGALVMRKLIILVICSGFPVAAHAQTTTTNCYGMGYSVTCTSNNNAQQQEQMNQAFRNLGQAIAARRERKRAEKAAEQARAKEEAVKAAVERAVASDTAIASPPPTDEEPIVLVCSMNGATATIALYENHHRADVTAQGVTKTRLATFTPDSVTWSGPVTRATLSRVDGTYTAYGNIPELEGQSLTGTCKRATERAF